MTITNETAVKALWDVGAQLDDLDKLLALAAPARDTYSPEYSANLLTWVVDQARQQVGVIESVIADRVGKFQSAA